MQQNVAAEEWEADRVRVSVEAVAVWGDHLLVVLVVLVYVPSVVIVSRTGEACPACR
jgi:hypothetical protein